MELESDYPVFDAATRSDRAFRLLLLNLFEQIQQNDAPIIESADAEAIHDFRVAIRRSRSLLGHSRGILPAKQVRAAKKSLSWLMRISNPVRDQQIFLEKLPAYAAELPAKCASMLDELRDKLQFSLALDILYLQRQLGSKRFQRFKAKWPDFLQAKSAKSTRLPHARTPLKKLADKLIKDAWNRVLEKGSHITLESPTAEVHKLRIACKRFRYTLEFFSSLYTESPVHGDIEALEGLQDELGALQDISVQLELLHQVSSLLGDHENCLQALAEFLVRAEDRQRRIAVQDFHDFCQRK